MFLRIWTAPAAITIIMAAPAAAAPRVVVEAPIKNFEVVAKGDVLKHTFTVKNEGDETLKITDVRPACGCTVAKFDESIEPGATGSIHVDLETLSFEGPIAKSIAAYTNDAESPRIELVVKAMVRPYIGVEPGYARFSYVQGEQTGGVPQTIWAPDGSDLEITAINNPYEHIIVKQRPATEEEKLGENRGKQWRLDIEILADAPVGALRDYIVVELDHAKQKKVQIPVSGFVRPRQHATPLVVDFGDVASADLPYERAIAFTSFITKGVEVTSVETGIDGIETEVVPMDEDGHRFQILLRMMPTAAKGAFQGRVEIRHTDEQSPTFEVPIKGRIL